MSKKKKKVKNHAFLAVIIFVLVSLLTIYFVINSIIASNLKTFGTKAVGTKVEIKNLRILPLSSSIEIGELVIENPKSYFVRNAVTAEKLHIKLNLSSLFSQKIIIERISVDNMYFDYEPKSRTSSNITDLVNNISAYIDSIDGSKKIDYASQKNSTMVIINELVINNGKVLISSPTIRSNIQFSLPRIVMRNLGSERDENAAYILQRVLNSIVDNILQGAQNTGTDAFSETSTELGRSIGRTLDSIGDSLGL